MNKEPGYSQKDGAPLEIVVCVIADGRVQLHESVLNEVRVSIML